MYVSSYGYRSSFAAYSSAAPVSYCGDGIVQAGEQCDAGSRNGGNNDNCTTTCQYLFVLTCGDGVMQAGEECDDRNARSGDGCNAQCKLEIGSCGDGIVQSARGEQCDKGTDFNGKSGIDCTAVCQWVPLSQCGDGILDPATEMCDQGALNGNYPASRCLGNCMDPFCGDGFAAVNEQCDDGNMFDGDGCDHTCRAESGAAPLTPIGADILDDGDGRYDHIPTPARTPTGPGLVIFLASGAAAGVGLVRRRFLDGKKR